MKKIWYQTVVRGPVLSSRLYKIIDVLPAFVFQKIFAKSSAFKNLENCQGVQMFQKF